MITSTQLMDGAHKLNQAAAVREQHAAHALVPIDKTALQKSADDLRLYARRLSTFGKCVKAYENAETLDIDQEHWDGYINHAETEYKHYLSQITPVKQEEPAE
jgi:hypothetical protein